MSTQHNTTIAILRRTERGGCASSQIAQSLTNWVERKHRTFLSPNYRSASVSVRFTDGRGNGFGRTVFDLYFSDGCGCRKQFTARTVGGAAVFWSQASYYATSLSDRIRRLFIYLLH